MALEKKGRLSEADFRKMSDDDPRKQSWLKAQKKYGEQGRFEDKKRDMEAAKSRAGGSSRTRTETTADRMSNAKDLATGYREAQQLKGSESADRRNVTRSRNLERDNQRRQDFREGSLRRKDRRSTIRSVMQGMRREDEAFQPAGTGRSARPGRRTRRSARDFNVAPIDRQAPGSRLPSSNRVSGRTKSAPVRTQSIQNNRDRVVELEARPGGKDIVDNRQLANFTGHLEDEVNKQQATAGGNKVNITASGPVSTGKFQAFAEHMQREMSKANKTKAPQKKKTPGISSEQERMNLLTGGVSQSPDYDRGRDFIGDYVSNYRR